MIIISKADEDGSMRKCKPGAQSDPIWAHEKR